MTPYYDDGLVTIYHGDCREVDAWDIAGGVMVTDPPYGMLYRSGMNGSFGECRVNGDESTDLRDFVLERWAPRPALVFGRWSVLRPAGTRMVLVWEKGESVGMGDLTLPWRPNIEDVYVIGRGFVGRRDRSSVLRYPSHPGVSTAHGTRHHPTEKPVGLMSDLIQRCPPVADIVDPFMGSGSTLRAAKNLGRGAVGVEIEERYCEIAARRLAQEVFDFEGEARPIVDIPLL